MEDALNNMLYNNNVNAMDSVIKTYIDNWYENNMISYASYLEDTIFCYNRSQANSSTNGWNPNGGRVNNGMNFQRASTLICSNVTDEFSVSNIKAKLTYPIGLPSEKEMGLLYDGSNLLKKAGDYWLGSISQFNKNRATGLIVMSSGSLAGSGINVPHGVRPVISLKPGTEYSSGTGSKNDPYIIDTLIGA